MISSMHLTLYGSEKTVEELRAFMRDVLRLPSYDAGGGWPIFRVPAEIGVHPEEGRAGKSTRYEMAFVCEHLDETMADLKQRGVEFVHDVHDAGWGSVTTFKMPGGINALLYEPRHHRPAT